MIVISLVLVIAAAVSLFIGLFIATDTLVFIWGAIALCLVSLFLLWLGTRQRKGAEPTSPSAPVYGGAAARSGGSTTPARGGTGQDVDDGFDEVASPADETVVIRDAPDTAGSSRGEAAAAAGATSSTPRKKAVVRKVPVKRAAGRTPVRKATAGTTRPAAMVGTTGASATSGANAAEARARLAQIAGVGPAKQDALLSQYGSLDGIRDASVDDIVANVRGFGEALATRVKRELG